MRYISIFILCTSLLISMVGCQLITLPLRLVGEVLKTIPFLSMQIEDETPGESTAVASANEVEIFQRKVEEFLENPGKAHVSASLCNESLDLKKQKISIIAIDLSNIKHLHELGQLYYYISSTNKVHYSFGVFQDKAELEGAISLISKNKIPLYGNGVFSKFGRPLVMCPILSGVKEEKIQRWKEVCYERSWTGDPGNKGNNASEH